MLAHWRGDNPCHGRAGSTEYLKCSTELGGQVSRHIGGGAEQIEPVVPPGLTAAMTYRVAAHVPRPDRMQGDGPFRYSDNP